MEIYKRDFDYNTLKAQGTGSHVNSEQNKIVVYPFDKYEIKLELTPANEFIGIVEIRVNKEFLSHKQKITSQGYHDVEEFYRE